MATEVSIARRGNKLYINSDGSINIKDISLKVIVDKTSSPTEYYGFATPGTATSASYWKIQRKTVSGSVTTYDFADGDTNFDNIWDNRGSLSYS